MPGEGLLPQALETVGVEPVRAADGAVEPGTPESPESPEAVGQTAVPEPPVHALAESSAETVPASFEPAERVVESDLSGEPPVHAVTESADEKIPASLEPVDRVAESEPAVVAPILDIPSPLAAAAPPVATAPLDTVVDALRSSQLQDRIEVVVGSGDVSLEISDSILFAPASAALSETGTGLLDEVAALLQTLPYSSLSVEGHTDNVPIQTARYPSNWELSSARAAAVTRALIEMGLSPDRIRAIGYGETRPRDDNGTEAGRARNRRVTFVLQLEGQG
jgi:chemotaxis protein MotB